MGAFGATATGRTAGPAGSATGHYSHMSKPGGLVGAYLPSRQVRPHHTASAIAPAPPSAAVARRAPSQQHQPAAGRRRVAAASAQAPGSAQGAGNSRGSSAASSSSSSSSASGGTHGAHRPQQPPSPQLHHPATFEEVEWNTAMDTAAGGPASGAAPGSGSAPGAAAPYASAPGSGSVPHTPSSWTPSRDSWDEVAPDQGDAASGGSGGEGVGGRVRSLLGLAGAVGLEVMITGSLVWTPLAAAVLALVVMPGARALSAAAAAAHEAEAVRCAEARVRAEMSARVPVTPPESAQWMWRLLGELWAPFVEPLMLRESLGNWAEKIRRAAPAGWELELVGVSMGTHAPQMSNYQVLADPSTGRVTGIDCDMALDSPSLRAVVRGSGPVGRFTVTIAGINMRGRIRLLPLPEQRMILFSFRQPPEMDVQLSIKGPVIGQRDIATSSFSFIRPALAAALQDSLVEPRRAAISLDPEVLVGQPLDTTFNIYIESVQGITPEGGSSGGREAAAAAAKNQHSDAAAAAGGGAAHTADRDKQTGHSGTASKSAASQAAAAAGEAVAEGAEAIASLVGQSSRQRRRMQIIALNMDSKLQRATRPVPYVQSTASSAAAAAEAKHSSNSSSAQPGPTSSSSASSASSSAALTVVPVQQLLRLNVGHKDGIFRIMVRDVGRGGMGGSAAGASSTEGPGGSSSASGAGATASGGGSGSLLGAVSLHVGAAKDGSTLMWAAREGGEPVAVRWRPSEGPWRVTLPLESPSFGLPPPTAAPSSGSSGGGSGAASSDASGFGGSISQQAQGRSSASGSEPLTSASDGGWGQGARHQGDRKRQAQGRKGGAGTSSPSAAGSPPAPPPLPSGPSITLLLSTDPWVYKEASPPGSQSDTARQRSLVVQVMEARDLSSRDWAGTCDPYVRISYDGKAAYRTRTIYNCSNTPVWQQTFVLPENPSLLTRRMRLSVYDSGVSRDDHLGSASLNLDMASEHGVQDRWLPLEGVERGMLRVRLAAVPDAPDSAAVRRTVEALEGLAAGAGVGGTAAGPAPAWGAEHVMGRGASGPLLQVVVLGARALSPRPAGQLLGMRDAYCNVLYNGARQVTPVFKRSHNPRWNFSALFALPAEEWEDEGSSSDEEETTSGGSGSGNGAKQVAQQAAVASASAAADALPASSADLFDGMGTASDSGWDMEPPPPPRAAALSSSSTSSPLPPYPAVPGASTSPAPAVGAVRRRRSGRSRSQPAPRRSQLLRLEVKDVDPVPPDDDLGFAELDLRQVVPQPGDSWQGWLPLRRGEGAEVLVRLARVDPAPLGEGELLRLPGVHDDPRRRQRAAMRQQQQQGGGGSGGAAGGPQDSGTAMWAPAGGAGGGEGWAGGEGTSFGPSPQMQRVLIDNFTDQVRAANRNASEMGQDLRVRLGQVVIPKLQDWWGGTLARTRTSLEPPGDQVAGWLRSTGLSSWMSGVNGANAALGAGKTQTPPPLLPNRAASTAGKEQAQEQQETTQQPAATQPAAPGAGAAVEGKAPATGAAVPAQSAAAGMKTAGGSSKGGVGGGGSEVGGVVGPDGNLGRMVSRYWEQMFGPPPYLRKERREAGGQTEQASPQEQALGAQQEPQEGQGKQ